MVYSIAIDRNCKTFFIFFKKYNHLYDALFKSYNSGVKAVATTFKPPKTLRKRLENVV
jgi:hypothetical protein